MDVVILVDVREKRIQKRAQSGHMLIATHFTHNFCPLASDDDDGDAVT